MSKSTPKPAPEETPAAEPTDAALLAASDSFEKRYGAQITERVRAGLTREQALQVQRDQVAADLAAAKASTPSKG